METIKGFLEGTIATASQSPLKQKSYTVLLCYENATFFDQVWTIKFAAFNLYKISNSRFYLKICMLN